MIHENFLLAAIRQAQSQSLFPFGKPMLGNLLYTPGYLTKDSESATTAAKDDSAPLTLDTLLEVSKKLVPIKPVQIFGAEGLVERKTVLRVYPRSKKKRIIKKWLKRYGLVVTTPLPDLIKTETGGVVSYFGHPETIRNMFKDVQQTAKDTVALSMCEVFGVKF